MKKVVDDPRLMIKVCDMYYNQEASRQEITETLGISRPTLARLLTSAKELGIVQIQIPDLDATKYWELEKELEKKFLLKQVWVTDSAPDKESLERNLGHAAVRYLRYILKDDMAIGISMGSTLFHMVSQIDGPYASGLTVVPLIGGMGKLRMELHSNHLAESLARICEGEFYPIHAPAKVSKAAVKKELMKEESIAQALDVMKKMEAAFLGIGFPNEDSAIKATGFYTQDEIESLIRRKAAGEICMQFYDENGSTEAYKQDNQVIGFDIAKLCRVPYSVGVAGGAEKMAAIRGAIRGRYINVLITDKACAEALLSS